MPPLVFEITQRKVYGPMANKKAISRLPEVIEESRTWSIGVLEYRDIKKHQSFSQYSNTPILQYTEIF